MAPGQTWNDLSHLRDDWRNFLVASGHRRLSLFFSNTFEFTAALLGSWSAGCTVILAGDATEQTATRLEGEVDAFLGEYPSRMGSILRPPQIPTEKTRPFPDIPLTLFTSGSTGQPTAIEKSVADVENEITTLENLFGKNISESRLYSTVSHQHIYGLLFRCLWPLMAGRPFAGEALRYPEELSEAMGLPGKMMLISSPAFLRRLPEAPMFDHPVSNLTAIFSSGGPLPWNSVADCVKAFKITPTEIYGSSETGGIAWRQRVEENQPFVTFPGVKIGTTENGNLILLDSPHRSSGLPFSSSDSIQSEAAGFHLLGRDDRIIKLEEKRLSLTAMEKFLATHPEVAEARLVLLTGERESLGAVLRLQGRDVPVRRTGPRDDLLKSLRNHLLKAFDRILLPRRWRFVEAMPVNSQGKTVQGELMALFEPQYGPVVLKARHSGDGSTVLDLDIPFELEQFIGHFPQAPLLPGVVQLNWAIQEGLRLFGPFGPFRGMRSIKFQRPIFPGMKIRLWLSPLKEKSGLAFHYESDSGRHASGQILFGTG